MQRHSLKNLWYLSSQARVFMVLGVPLATAAYAVSVVLMWLSLVLLSDAACELDPREPPENFGELAQRTLGTRGKLLVSGTSIVSSIMGMCGHTILIGGLGTTLVQRYLLPAASIQVVTVVVATTVVLPLGFIKSIGHMVSGPGTFCIPPNRSAASPRLLPPGRSCSAGDCRCCRPSSR